MRFEAEGHASQLKRLEAVGKSERNWGNWLEKQFKYTQDSHKNQGRYIFYERIALIGSAGYNINYGMN